MQTQTQTIYGVICELEDGTANIRWFRHKESVDNLLRNDENYYINEGVCPSTLTLPMTLDLKECGFIFSDEN